MGFCEFGLFGLTSGLLRFRCLRWIYFDCFCLWADSAGVLDLCGFVVYCVCFCLMWSLLALLIMWWGVYYLVGLLVDCVLGWITLCFVGSLWFVFGIRLCLVIWLCLLYGFSGVFRFVCVTTLGGFVLWWI